MVDIFEVVALSPNLLRVSWDPPLSPNGVLTGYQVEVVNLIDASDLLYLMAEDMQQRNISDTIGKTNYMYKKWVVLIILLHNLRPDKLPSHLT